MRPVIIGFGLLIVCLLILFRLGEVNFEKGNIKLEVIVAIAAFVFFFAGLYFNYKSQNKKAAEPAVETSITSGNSIDYEQVKKSGLTQREHDVLVKMSEGLSNQEIAAALFLSKSTVKTHVSNVLFKLDAKRRTEAIRIAKDKKIVA